MWIPPVCYTFSSSPLRGFLRKPNRRDLRTKRRQILCYSPMWTGIERLVQPLHADVRWSGTSSLWVYNYFFCSVENLSWELPGSPRLTWENSTCSERKTRTFRDKLRELVQFKGYFPYFKSFVICLPQILSFTVQITHIFCYLPPLTNNNNWLKMHVYQC